MKIMLVSESWNEDEAKAGKPFEGSTGFVLNGMLKVIGLPLGECYRTTVFNLQRSVESLCGSKAEGLPGWPALIKGKYVRKEYSNEIERLYDEIRREDPNVIVALGPAAAWALLRSSGIKAIRGSAAPTHPEVSRRLGRTFKVIPTFHPSAVMREWTLRPIVINDLDKARREADSPEVNRPKRSVWIKPSLADLQLFQEKYIDPASILSIDIETKGDQITCIGFAPDPSVALVIPFYAVGYPGCNYWPDLPAELEAWRYVREWCKKPSVFQNGMYDIHFLWRRYGIAVPNAIEDTMLMHHAYQLEMEKGLGFLASIYTDEASWKFMRKSSTIKKGD